MEQLIKKTPQEIAKYIEENPSFMNGLGESDLIQLLQKINPYCQTIKGDNKFVLFSALSPKQEYIQKFESLAVIRFIQRMITEYDDISLKLNVDKDKVDEYKNVLNQFFDYLFKYDPKYHVRTSYQDKCEGDETRIDMTEEQKNQLPPLDFFERLNRYKEQHNEILKTEMKNSYAVQRRIDYAIQIYDVFNSEYDADKFKDEHGPGLSVDLYKAITNKWVLIESNEKNAENVKYYGKENEILENMIHQLKKDQEIGHQMIEKRKKESAQQNSKISDQEKKQLQELSQSRADMQIKRKLFETDQAQNNFIGGTDLRFIENDGKTLNIKDIL